VRLSVVSGGVSQLIRPAETKLMLPDIFPLEGFFNVSLFLLVVTDFLRCGSFEWDL